MTSPRVLLTGFEPFSGRGFNVSESVARKIDASGIHGVEISTIILSVDEVGSRKCSELIRSGHHFDAIVHLGLSERRRNISLESLAKNNLEMSKPDNSGRMVSNSSIAEDAPDFIRTTASKHILDEEFEHDVRVLWSEDAGGFVCNETFFRTLEAIGEKETPVLFVHLPVPEHIAISEQTDIVSRIIRRLAIKPHYRVVGALLTDPEGRMLACRRPQGDAWAGWWEFPGGKIEENESQELALIREIDEELGILVSPISCVAEISHDYGDRDVDLFIWKCEPVDPASIILSEHDKSVWVGKDGLIGLKWLPADLPLIEEWSSSGIP
ncbi:MAG: NUDIX domain-containing protein [Candidatus Thalassarchaeaceae archaeon]|nr:hypothetical protein [Euryarchaeota archaeon]MDP6871721.1 NUDIX domain-containing protein [Candidatus Thalassarchaeaceae archaeon]